MEAEMTLPDEPPPSVNWKANARETPVPEEGVTESAVTTKATVHVPRACNPVLPAEPAAFRYTFLAPLKAGRKLMARVSVSTVPDIDTLDPAPFRMHWLFC